jgi:hypothetical protein
MVGMDRMYESDSDVLIGYKHLSRMYGSESDVMF